MYGDELPNKYFTTSSRRQGAFKYNVNKREKKSDKVDKVESTTRPQRTE
jgi:hypothetical protein